MKRLLFGLVLSVMATAASAQAQWVQVSETGNRDKIYTDPTTKARKGNIVRVWHLYDFVKSQVTGSKPFYSAKVYTQFDCAERTTQILQIDSFVGQMGTGEIEGISNTPGTKGFVAPGSINEILLNLACK